MHLRLYNKPKGKSGCTLAAFGTFPFYRSGEAYEGRIKVSGARGSVWVSGWSGTLPPGATVDFDTGTSEVVVKWPAYDAGHVHDDLDNLNFEAGDDGSWDKGAGWTIMQGVTAPDPNDPGSLWQAQFANQGGESEIMSHRAIKAVPGKTYTASVDVQQGASSKNHAGAAVRLRFFDATGAVAAAQDGNVVKSGSDSHWHTSSLSVPCPANAATVKLGAAAFRNHENEPLWVDGFTWNGAYDKAGEQVGTNGHDPFPITISLRDSAGCRALWVGQIEEYAIYFTSQLYGIFVDDGEEGAPLVTGGRVENLRSGNLQQSDEDSPLVSGGSVVALNLIRTVEYTTLPTQGPDDADSPLVTGGSVQVLNLVATVKYTTLNLQGPDDADSPLVTGGSVQALNMVVTTGYQTYNAAQDDVDSPLVTGGSVTNLSLTKVA